MKKRKGYIISILVFILILCTLIGCGKTPSGSDSTQGAVTETETEKGTQLGSEEDTSNTEDFATETEENIFPQYVMTDIDYRAVVEADEDMMVSTNEMRVVDDRIYIVAHKYDENDYGHYLISCDFEGKDIRCVQLEEPEKDIEEKCLAYITIGKDGNIYGLHLIDDFGYIYEGMHLISWNKEGKIILNTEVELPQATEGFVHLRGLEISSTGDVALLWYMQDESSDRTEVIHMNRAGTIAESIRIANCSGVLDSNYDGTVRIPGEEPYTYYFYDIHAKSTSELFVYSEEVEGGRVVSDGINGPLILVKDLCVLQYDKETKTLNPLIELLNPTYTYVEIIYLTDERFVIQYNDVEGNLLLRICELETESK